jgi:hypothetical protein
MAWPDSVPLLPIAEGQRKNNFAGETVAQILVSAASRLISTLFGPLGTKRVETSLDPAGMSARATWARSQM